MKKFIFLLALICAITFLEIHSNLSPTPHVLGGSECYAIGYPNWNEKTKQCEWW